MNTSLIHSGDAELGFDVDKYTIMDARIGAILQRLANDAELRTIMIEFLTHYRDFYQQTNIVLDAMGFENILFFKDDNNAWQFKIGSVIKHDTGKYTSELFAAIHDKKEVNLSEFVNFTHAYFSPANIRAVNVCAMKLGLAPIIHDVKIDPDDLMTVSQRLSIPQKMLAYAQHGDFEKMETLLQENKAQLTLSISDSWAYPRIANEYIKHGQSIALQNYLAIVSQLPVILPEKIEDQMWVINSKTAIHDLKTMYDKKTTSGRHDPVRGVNVRAASQTTNYPLVMQNNIASPQANAMNRAQGSTAAPMAQDQVGEPIVMTSTKSKRMDS